MVFWFLSTIAVYNIAHNQYGIQLMENLMECFSLQQWKNKGNAFSHQEK
jgi:hypothetical protein